MPLATFVHISDLHFGHVDPTSFDARAPRLWAKHSGFDGLLGHSHNSLRRVEKFFAQIQRAEDAQLIVTGDLTTVGHPDQFTTATLFLGNILRPPKGNYVGLRVPGWKSKAVPGNHDHWPGHAGIWGRPTSGLSATFPVMPYVNDPPLHLSSGHELRFMGIDTDADVSSYGKDRFLARGAFTSQLTRLAGMLGIPTPNEIRVLCLHHSQELRSIELEMDALSRDSLHDFIVTHDIAVLLCGHVHTPPLVKSFPATHLMRTVNFLEARCGTTTQISTLPHNWRTILGRRPRRLNRMPNSLLVHRLFSEGAEIYWHTEVYMEKPQGFSIPTSLPPGILIDNPVKVWPRP
jgi:3',5'-cyclic AMP phosphodiesterase CpdA